MLGKMCRQIEKSVYFTLNKKAPLVWGPEKRTGDILGRLKFGPVIVFDPYSPDPAASF